MAECRQDVYNSHLGLIIHVAKKYYKVASAVGIQFEELLSEGCIGLLEAYNRYDKEKNSKLSTYATIWIKKRISDAINKKRNRDIIKREDIEILNFDEEYEDKEGKKKNIYDRFYVEGSYEEYERNLDNEELREIIEELISKLPKEYEEVIRMRYGIGMEEKSLSEIAKKMKCTKRQIFRIEKTALEILKTLASKKNLEYFLY